MKAISIPSAFSARALLPELQFEGDTPARLVPSTPRLSASKSTISTLPSAGAGSTSRWNRPLRVSRLQIPRFLKKTSSAFSICSSHRACVFSSRSCRQRYLGKQAFLARRRHCADSFGWMKSLDTGLPPLGAYRACNGHEPPWSPERHCPRGWKRPPDEIYNSFEDVDTAQRSCAAGRR